MSHHIYAETDIVPVTKSIRVRGSIGDSGPRLVAFSYQTTTADLTAGAVTMRVRYEDVKSQIINVEATPITLTAIEEVNGGIRSMDAFLCRDHYFYSGVTPGDGLPFLSGGDDDAYGLFVIELDLGGPAGTALMSYQVSVELLDGSPSVTYYP